MTSKIFLPTAQWDIASTDPQYHGEECRFSGLVLDSMDVAYFLDGDNQVIHAVQVSYSSLTYVWSLGTSP